jgi:hypothetical protein
MDRGERLRADVMGTMDELPTPNVADSAYQADVLGIADAFPERAMHPETGEPITQEERIRERITGQSFIDGYTGGL